jgi:hypothetical protein
MELLAHGTLAINLRVPTGHEAVLHGIVRHESQCRPIRESAVVTTAPSHSAVTKQIADINEPLRLRKDAGSRRTSAVSEMAEPNPITMQSNGDWKYSGRMNMRTMAGISRRTTLFCCLLSSRCLALPASRALTISMSRSSGVFIASPFLVFDTPTPNFRFYAGYLLQGPGPVPFKMPTPPF